MNFDIAIVGNGLTGGALALSLSMLPLTIVLIDAETTLKKDHRMYALNKNSINVLKNIGVFSALEKAGTLIKAIHISEKGRFGSVYLTAGDMNLPYLGAMVEAQRINTAFRQRLENNKNITWLKGGRLERLLQDKEQAYLTVNTSRAQQNITAKLVLGADGAHSTVRELVNIATKEINYAQKALVTRVVLKRFHDNVAYERFSLKGVIAMLPLAQQEAALIWSGKDVLIDHLLSLPEDKFLERLQTDFGYRLGHFCAIGKRFSYPIKGIFSKEIKKEKVMLVGNAAHTIHPLAAQGLNLALYEVAQLYDYFKENKKESLELPSDEHSFKIKKFNIYLADHLNRLFSMDFFLLNWLRQAAMVSVDVNKLLKKQLGEKIMCREALPSLCFVN